MEMLLFEKNEKFTHESDDHIFVTRHGFAHLCLCISLYFMIAELHCELIGYS